MKKRDDYPDSTIGMTAYNVLCMHSKPLNIDDIHTVSANLQHRGLTTDQLQRCLDKLIELKRIRKGKKRGTYELIADKHLFVVLRDRSDYDEVTMEGGWDGWCVKDPRIRDGQGTRPLEALIGLPLTNRQPSQMTGDRS